jgi:hypothetical protein
MARHRGDPEFLRARRYLADPPLGDPTLERRFVNPRLAAWLSATKATLVRPIPSHPTWSVWRMQFFLGSGPTPHAAIARARHYFRAWRHARSHPYRTAIRQLPSMASPDSAPAGVSAPLANPANPHTSPDRDAPRLDTLHDQTPLTAPAGLEAEPSSLSKNSKPIS